MNARAHMAGSFLLNKQRSKNTRLHIKDGHNQELLYEADGPQKQKITDNKLHCFTSLSQFISISIDADSSASMQPCLTYICGGIRRVPVSDKTF